MEKNELSLRYRNRYLANSQLSDPFIRLYQIVKTEKRPDFLSCQNKRCRLHVSIKNDERRNGKREKKIFDPRTCHKKYCSCYDQPGNENQERIHRVHSRQWLNDTISPIRLRDDLENWKCSSAILQKFLVSFSLSCFCVISQNSLMELNTLERFRDIIISN